MGRFVTRDDGNQPLSSLKNGLLIRSSPVLGKNCMTDLSSSLLFAGNMMPRKEEPVPSSVLLAQQIMTRLGDFSAMTEQDDLYSNIKALAQTFITVGE